MHALFQLRFLIQSSIWSFLAWSHWPSKLRLYLLHSLAHGICRSSSFIMLAWLFDQPFFKSTLDQQACSISIQLHLCIGLHLQSISHARSCMCFLDRLYFEARSSALITLHASLYSSSTSGSSWVYACKASSVPLLILSMHVFESCLTERRQANIVK